jgi:oligopeptide/dipeptide ABC transporter ATP-binding protein
MALTSSLLEVDGLRTYFFTSQGVVKAVDGIGFKVGSGEVVGLVGESGSGKSVTALSIMRLVPSPPGRTTAGKVLFRGNDLLQLSEEQMRDIRGGKIAMSFQDPMTYLNPVIRVGEQVAETILLHQDVDKTDAMKRAVELMELVQISSAKERAMDYPHQFSGGMRQRILLAMAISCNPDLLIADEPTTALDVIIQGEILELLKELREKVGSSLLLISHDLGVVGELADKVAIMYAGNIVEFADANTIFEDPRHPYTIGLLESVPTLEGAKKRLKSIEGAVPSLINPPEGCRFHPRCARAKEHCALKEPSIIRLEDGHFVMCHSEGKA